MVEAARFASLPMAHDSDLTPSPRSGGMTILRNKESRVDLMKSLLTAAFASALVIGASAHATQPPSHFSREYDACIEKAGPPGFYDQSAPAACNEAEIKRLKLRINKAYNKLVKLWADDPEGVAQLDKAQKTWVQARDETLSLLQERGGHNGQVVFIVSSGYLLDALAERAELLEGIIASNGGE